MKKYIIVLLSVTTLLTTFSSCEDSDKSPLVLGETAPFMKFEADNTLLDLADPASAISGTFFSDVPELIESHEVFVALQNNVNSPVFESFVLITELPFEFNATLQDIAEVLNVDPASILPGDTILFRNVSTGTNGATITIDTAALSGETVSVAQQQGYSFDGVVTCPFVITDIPEGTYDVVELGFGAFFTETSTTRTIELGPGPDQITIVEGEYPIEGSEPLIITLDLETGNVTGVNEDGISFGFGPVSAANGFPINTYVLNAEPGNVLSCIGLITLGLDFAPFGGNEHSFILRAAQ